MFMVKLMNRIKVVNDVSELVAVLRAVDNELKLDVFKEVMVGWKTKSEIEQKFGKGGVDALALLEKMKLIETRWQPGKNGTEMSFHTFYTSFHINLTCPINEISDVLSAAMTPEKEFIKFERLLEEMTKADGSVYVGDVMQKTELSLTLLKGLIRRSAKYECRGHRIERIKRV